VRFVHAADVHLDSPLRGLARYPEAPHERVRSATRRAFEALIELCLEERADLLILAGDLYDGEWRDHATGLFLHKQLARLKETRTHVVTLRGNHDAASRLTRQLALPPHVKELAARKPETVLFEELGVAVHGQSFANAAVTEDLAANYPDPVPGFFNIGVLHTALDGREGHDRYAPTSVSVLVDKGYGYWALGHVHQREVVRENPWIVYPGNLQGRHARELGAKGATLVEVEAQRGQVRSVEHVALDVVRWAQVEVSASGAASRADLLDELRVALRDATEAAGERLLAVRVVVCGRTPVHAELARDVDRFETEVRALATELDDVWIEKVRLETNPAEGRDAVVARADLLGSTLRAFAEATNRPELALELLPELEELRRKVPAELQSGFDGIRLKDPEYLKRALGRAESLVYALLEEDAR
jgi:DNA repair exonuclease SbcCD nuclease subunit